MLTNIYRSEGVMTKFRKASLAILAAISEAYAAAARSSAWA